MQRDFHHGLLGIAFVAVMAAAIPSAAQSSSEELMLDWLALVRAHEAGTMDDAATSAAEWSPELIDIVLPQALATIDASTLRRALSMHTDIALAQQVTMGRPTVGSRTAVVLLDGKPLEAIPRAQPWRICWAIATGLVTRPDQRPVIAAWFRAAGAVLQQLGDADLLAHHLDTALSLFPRDAVIALQTGTLHQTFADARVQEFMKRRQASPLPSPMRTTGESKWGLFEQARRDQDRRMGVGRWAPKRNEPVAADVELGLARDFFRRALRLDPSLREAQIRLAHVMADLGHHEEAVATVTPVLAGTLVPFFEFYAAVLLGRSEEHLGHLAAAADAYARAAARFPGAPSAELGRSRVALAQGRTGDAIAIAVGVVGPGSEAHADPWSSCFRVHDPDAGALLAAWRASAP
jgi:hypothetical protein